MVVRSGGSDGASRGAGGSAHPWGMWVNWKHLIRDLMVIRSDGSEGVLREAVSDDANLGSEMESGV